jgi:hypothetical protein
MPSTNKNPIDVTLNESTGTWEMPGAAKRRIKPWQRLWFVSGIIYLLMLAGSYYMLMPTRQSIEQKMVFSVTEEVKRYDGMAFAGESPQMNYEIARSQGFVSWINQTRSIYRIGHEGDVGFARIEKSYSDAVTDLPMKRIVGILICIIAWVVPMAAFYAVGFVVDWIKRGMRGVKV